MICFRRAIAAALVAAPGALLLIAAPAPAKSETKTVEAGPIWNQMDAENKCPKVARAADAKWTGKWWTTIPGRMSVCEIKKESAWGGGGGGIRKKTVDAGPIWNQIDAQMKCPKAASKAGATWTGQWWTTVPGRMSVCEIRR